MVLYRSVSSRLALREFEGTRTLGADGSQFLPADVKPEFGLWNPKRVAAYNESLRIRMAPPLAVLRIDKLQLRVPVFHGTDELVLNRGVGHIAGTPRPGEEGNIGIAGHRDGFFRPLKDIAVGDRVDVTTVDNEFAFTVDDIEIVNPEDVYVLQPRPQTSLTLVTCYPFYFVGDAPQRYIVHASITGPVESTKTIDFRSETENTTEENKK
jgi:sortase A